MTELEHELINTLKGCVKSLESQMTYLNSDQRRQVRRAWVLIAKVEEQANVAS